MGKRGPGPWGVGTTGKIAEVLSLIQENPTWRFTGPTVADILGCKPTTAACYPSRLHKAGRIRKITYGEYAANVALIA